jgi:hypothetical protein
MYQETPYTFDFKKLVARREQELDTRIARSLFQLMGNKGIHCALVPENFGTKMPLLEESVNRLFTALFTKTTLADFKSSGLVRLAHEDGKLGINVEPSAVQNDDVQHRLKEILQQAFTQAAQLGI